MKAAARWYEWRPSPVGGIAGALVIAGLVLTQVASWWFLALAAAGAFGPGLLREMGLLHDQDEFQQRAARRAGYHAYLATGAVLFLVYAYTRAGNAIPSPEELSGFYLALLTFAWMFSSLFSYWGARRTAFIILLVFGVAWAVFNIWSNLQQPVTMLMQLLITTAPFFVLAFASRRWPRAAGAGLLALSAFFLFVYFRGGANLPLVVKAQTAVLFAGPLLTSGFALAGSRSDDDAAGEAA